MMTPVVIAMLAMMQSQPAKQPAPPKEPTLDELLGIAKPAPEKTENKAEGKPTQPPEQNQTAEGDASEVVDPLKDPTRAELDRQLANAQPASDDLVKAVALLRESEQRLKANDAGAQTQRVQDEAIKLLDRLIEQAKQNQQKQQQKQQQQKQQQQSQSEQQQQQKQSSQQQQQNQQQQQQSQGEGKGGTPASAQAQTRQLPQGAQAAWGNLPPHVRDALMQGAGDTYSSTWEQLTSDYYKRLAEKEAGASRTGTSSASPARNPR